MRQANPANSIPIVAGSGTLVFPGTGTNGILIAGFVPALVPSSFRPKGPGIGENGLERPNHRMFHRT